jgi:transcriptional regulator with XRE-family HTH domain
MRQAVGAESLTTLVWGKRVRVERAARGWSQLQLADLAGVSQSVISRLERGEPGLRDGRRVRIAKALGLSAAELFPYREEEDDEVADADPPAPREELAAAS